MSSQYFIDCEPFSMIRMDHTVVAAVSMGSTQRRDAYFRQGVASSIDNLKAA
jgi:hypothetical protein